MNRRQRRIQAAIERKQGSFKNQMPQEAEPDFSEVPNVTLCQSIQLLIDELRGRGFQIYDFDNKVRSLQQIQIIGGNIYFLAAAPGEEDENEARQE